MPPLKITVATVTYHAGKLIGRTIRSVEEQTYPLVVHVFVEGKSQDDTLAQFHHFQERYSVAGVPHEIACLSEPDHGLYDAMNKAIDMATGHYIVFLNAGDRLHGPDTLERVARAAQSAGGRPAVIYGDTNLVDDAGNFVRRRRLTPPERLNWRSFKQGMLVCHQAFYARTDLARKFRYNCHYRFSADFDWCVRILREAERKQLATANLHAVVADYLNEGMTTKDNKASLR